MNVLGSTAKQNSGLEELRHLDLRRLRSLCSTSALIPYSRDLSRKSTPEYDSKCKIQMLERFVEKQQK